MISRGIPWRVEFAGHFWFGGNYLLILLISLNQVQNGPLCTLEYGNGSFGSIYLKKEKVADKYF